MYVGGTAEEGEREGGGVERDSERERVRERERERERETHFSCDLTW